MEFIYYIIYSVTFFFFLERSGLYCKIIQKYHSSTPFKVLQSTLQDQRLTVYFIKAQFINSVGSCTLRDLGQFWLCTSRVCGLAWMLLLGAGEKDLFYCLRDSGFLVTGFQLGDREAVWQPPPPAPQQLCLSGKWHMLSVGHLHSPLQLIFATLYLYILGCMSFFFISKLSIKKLQVFPFNFALCHLVLLCLYKHFWRNVLMSIIIYDVHLIIFQT